MENKMIAGITRVRYLGNVRAAKYGLYLGDEARLEDVLIKALGGDKGDKPVEFLGEIVVMVRPLEGAGLTVEEVSGE